MQTRILSVALVVSTVFFLRLGQMASAQGVVSLLWTGQSKCYDESGGEISCAGTRQDGDVQAGVDWPSPRFTVSGETATTSGRFVKMRLLAGLPRGYGRLGRR